MCRFSVSLANGLSCLGERSFNFIKIPKNLDFPAWMSHTERGNIVSFFKTGLTLRRKQKMAPFLQLGNVNTFTRTGCYLSVSEMAESDSLPHLMGSISFTCLLVVPGFQTLLPTALQWSTCLRITTFHHLLRQSK